MRQVHTIGRDTREWLVAGDRCAALREAGVEMAGVTDAAAGFEFVREGWTLGQVLACFAGEGRVRVGDDELPCARGQAYVTPPLRPHAYRAVRGTRWGVCWAMLRPPAPRRPCPLAHVADATLVHADPRPLRWAILGLYHESIGAADATLLRQWSATVAHLAARIAGRGPGDRLWPLWTAVDAQLEREWSLDDLAALAHLSPEHLRRLCHAHLGRSPMAHLARLRMQRAATLLRMDDAPIKLIAERVGYADRFAFTTAFRRHIGVPPAAYRRAGTTSSAAARGRPAPPTP